MDILTDLNRRLHGLREHEFLSVKCADLRAWRDEIEMLTDGRRRNKNQVATGSVSYADHYKTINVTILAELLSAVRAMAASHGKSVSCVVGILVKRGLRK
jgi:hypothetical protein